MKIAYAQMNVAAGRPDENTHRILHLIERARAGGAKLVIFPELAVSGQFLGDTFLQETFLQECERYTEEIIAASKNLTVMFGNIRLKRDLSSLYVFNGVFVATNGKLKNFCAKEHLSADEQRYFSAPFETPSVVEVEIGGDDFEVVPLFEGDGIELTNFDFAIKFSCAPFSLTKNIADEKILAEEPLICVGAVGLQNTGKTVYTFDGGSGVFNSRSEIVQLAEPFVESLNFVELEKIDKMPAIEVPVVDETEKIYRALSYGVKNFLQEIGIGKVVIGVSGGIDSAVAAALYTKILGAENVLLVNMPSVFNSATTRGLSEQLAKNLGCKYCVVPIQESVDWTVKQLESTPIIFLSDGTDEKITLSSFVRENIQARDRSSRILAALSAAIGGGFTCNANKAETTVGYATLYGDEAGFLSALADLWKFQVYALANYMNEKIFGSEVIPQGIIDIVPSAELSTAQNVDEGKGDPLKYPYHDYLFRAFVEENLRPEDILRLYERGEVEKRIGCAPGLVKKYFPTAADFVADLERWWKQFTCMGVAKRIQAPPILAVTNHPFGARRESQNGWHVTKTYKALKDNLLA